MWVFLCGNGLLSIFAQDSVWKWVLWQNQIRGVVSKRTPQWEASQAFAGIAMIVIGFALLFLIPYSHHSAYPTTQTVSSSEPNVTIDGHPATPAEREAILQQTAHQKADQCLPQVIEQESSSHGSHKHTRRVACPHPGHLAASPTPLPVRQLCPGRPSLCPASLARRGLCVYRHPLLACRRVRSRHSGNTRCYSLEQPGQSSLSANPTPSRFLSRAHSPPV